jgi:glycosyltransferase involved in cell wall biosynthesis
MPILLLLTSAYPPIAGGAETYAGQLASALSTRGWDVTVATDGSRLPTGAVPKGVKIARLTDYTHALSATDLLAWEQMYFSLLSELVSISERLQPDVVFSNGLETAILGRMLADSIGVPLAANFHEHEPEADPAGFGKLRLVYDRLRPELVLAGSRMYEARALRFGPAKNVYLIPHGIDVPSFCRAQAERETTRTGWHIDDDERVYVCPGRFKERKGQIYALRAFGMFASRHDVLVFVGSVSSGSEQYRNELLAEASELKRGRVLIDEGRGPDDMAPVYGAADVVILPSLSEGLGFTLLEAMASGAPTVATDIAGFREVVGNSGVVPLVPPSDPSALATAIVRVTEADAETQRLQLDAARQLVAERFSLDAMGRATDRHLRRLLLRANPQS